MYGLKPVPFKAVPFKPGSLKAIPFGPGPLKAIHFKRVPLKLGSFKAGPMNLLIECAAGALPCLGFGRATRVALIEVMVVGL
jgi:hypothetical protein